jgi:hypothetical protein
MPTLQKNHYLALGLSSSGYNNGIPYTNNEILTAYGACISKCASESDESKHLSILSLNESKDILTDEFKRKQFDKLLIDSPLVFNNNRLIATSRTNGQNPETYDLTALIASSPDRLRPILDIALNNINMTTVILNSPALWMLIPIETSIKFVIKAYNKFFVKAKDEFVEFENVKKLLEDIICLSSTQLQFINVAQKNPDVVQLFLQNNLIDIQLFEEPGLLKLAEFYRAALPIYFKKYPDSFTLNKMHLLQNYQDLSGLCAEADIIAYSQAKSDPGQL